MSEIQVGLLPREFEYKGQTLSDPNPQMSVKDVISHYSNQFPEMANGFEKDQNIQDGKLVVKIVTAIGVKG